MSLDSSTRNGAYQVDAVGKWSGWEATTLQIVNRFRLFMATDASSTQPSPAPGGSLRAYACRGSPTTWWERVWGGGGRAGLSAGMTGPAVSGRLGCVGEPVRDGGRADRGVLAGQELSLGEDGTDPSGRIGNDVTAVILGLQPAGDQLVEPEGLWAGDSTMPFTGSPTAVGRTAVATSSAAIGCMSTGATWTVSRSVAPSAMPLRNSKDCVACTIE